MEGDKTKKLPPNPVASANILSKLTISWTFGIFKKGFKKELQVHDLYEPLEDYRSIDLGNKLDRCWQTELGRAKLKDQHPSLLRALLSCFGGKLFFYGTLMFIGEVLFRTAQPLLLSQMLKYFSPESTMQRSEACWYAAGVVVCTGVSVVINNPVWLGSLLLAMKMRVACCSAIYRKSLRLSQAALGQASVGQAVNLMANDVNRFDAGIVYLHFLWIGPVTTVLVTYFIWLEVGPAALVGTVAILVFVPVQMLLGKQKAVYRCRTAKRTDERIRLMSEILNGIRVIKMYTWEKPFEKLILEARRLEIKEIRGSLYITGVLLSFLLFNNHLAIFSSLVTYVLMGNLLTASTAYVVTAYFLLIRNLMSEFFPFAIGTTAELLVSIDRIEKFMLSDEITRLYLPKNSEKINLAFDSDLTGDLIKDDFPETIKYSRTGGTNLNAVVLKNASAKWCNESSEDTLRNININFQSGKLSVIIGPVGSGKSSLLQVILRELPLRSGYLQTSGCVSYAPQDPWLFEGSVRQNILFGSAYNEDRYRQVVQICALRADLRQLPHGDQTLVGDRGTVLSGGQRARINLARAVYKDSDIYLLDNPLSAVDTQVGKHLFDKCITGFLKEKTVILVTHQMEFLGASKHIILLQKGNVRVQGSFQELKGSGADFSSIMCDKETENEDSNITEHSTSKRTLSESEENEQEAVKEARTEGSVTWKVFFAYLTAGGHWKAMFFMLFMFSITQCFVSAQDYWLNYWVNLEEYVYQFENNSTMPEMPVYLSQTSCMIVFSSLISATVVITLVRSFFFVYMCMRSSIWLHKSLFSSITRAIMMFFHTNPSGRILNRFSKDLGSVDELLPTSLLHVMQIGMGVIGIVIVLAVVNAWLLIPSLIVGYIFYLLRKFYLKTSRGVKRLEGITRSPVFSHLNASLQGLTTIRAFRAEEVLEKEFDDHQDLHSSAFHIFAATSQAFGYWLDIVCFLYVGMITFSFFLFDQSWLGGSVGLAITQTIAVVGIFQFGMRQSADLENFMTSVERILEYTKVEEEPPLESQPDQQPPSNWPPEGNIEFRRVTMSYSPSLSPVLKDLSFTILPREKIGIVGRTGAGKSSLTAALFRLSPVQGMIIIDNIDVSQIGLHDLRSKLSIIPQEPVLFSGTVRKNLDPFDEYSDATLWSALEEVQLKSMVDYLQEGLSSKITDDGSNLSLGQRQLMCLARAIVRNNRILVLDEATANVDHQTDALIQSTIRRKFAECTVLTIAHRLNTVMDSDKILVMNNGHMVEFDHPHILLSNKNGYFYKMVEELGKNAAESLHSIAASNYNKHIILGRTKGM